MAREPITFKGEKDVWQNFTLEVKRRRQEIWNVLKPIIERYSSFSHEKIKTCINAALSEYYADRIIDKVVYCQEVPDTDGNFTQIGHRPLIEKKFFQEDKGDTYRSPILPSLGIVVAKGEINFLVGEILKNQSVNRETIAASKADINFLSNKASSIGHETTIFMPVKFYTALYNDRQAHTRIKAGKPKTLDNHNLVLVTEDVLRDKIVILDKMSAVYRYVRAYNPVTDRSEILHIQIGIEEKDEKTDVLVRTMVQMKLWKVEGAHILEINNSS